MAGFIPTVFTVLLICLGRINEAFSLNISELFPFEESQGNTRLQLPPVFYQPSNVKIVNFENGPFKLFNKSFDSAIISQFGVVSFTHGNRPHINILGGSCGPDLEDIIHVMGFWSFTDSNRDPSGTKLLYQETTSKIRLNKAKADITEAFPEFRSTLNLNRLFIVSWINLPSHQEHKELSKRNTFQLVLASSATQSFVIFYYPRIEWSDGVNWTSGFDFGMGRPMFKLPGSCSQDFGKIMEGSNLIRKQPGKWVFRVDSSVEESCLAMPASPDKLQFEPKTISILGNVPLLAQGLRVRRNVQVTCKFHDPSLVEPLTTTGILSHVNSEDGENEAEVICPAPFLYSLGKVELVVVVACPGRSDPITFKGSIHVVKEFEGNHNPSPKLNHTHGNFLLLSPDDHSTYLHIIADNRWLSLSWNPELLSMDAILESSILRGPEEYAELVVMEYSGHEWSVLGPISHRFQNSGKYENYLDKSALARLTRHSAHMLFLRALAIKFVHRLKNGVELSKILPASVVGSTDILLTAALQPAWHPQGQNIFYGACQTWHSNERRIPPALSCPRTVKQAENDWRFMRDNVPQSHLRIMNPGANFSFIQRVPSPHFGSGTHCTYNTAGLLLENSLGSGRVHRWSPNNVRRYWDHYVEDVTPYLYCYRWMSHLSANRSMSLHDEKRPGSEGSNYSSPRPARATGVTHVSTFDGYNYTTLSTGDFWLLKYSDRTTHPNKFIAQVRVEPYVATNHLINSPPVITSVALENTCRDESVLNMVVNSGSGKIHVSVNGEKVDTEWIEDGEEDDPINFYFNGVSLSFKRRNEAIASFSSGLSMAFLTSPKVNDSGSLNIVIKADYELEGKLEGWLGNFDGNVSNDELFVKSIEWKQLQVAMNESIFPKWEAIPQTHFGSNWGAMFFGSYYLPDHEFCGGSGECTFDYHVTGSSSIAEGGKTARTLYDEGLSLLKPAKCGVPEISQSYIAVNSTEIGSTVLVACYPGYELLPRGAGKTGRFRCEKESYRSHSPRWLNVEQMLAIQFFRCSPLTPTTTPVPATHQPNVATRYIHLPPSPNQPSQNFDDKRDFISWMKYLFREFRNNDNSWNH